MPDRSKTSCEKRIIDACIVGGYDLGKRVYSAERRLNRSLDSFEDIIKKYGLELGN